MLKYSKVVEGPGPYSYVTGKNIEGSSDFNQVNTFFSDDVLCIDPSPIISIIPRKDIPLKGQHNSANIAAALSATFLAVDRETFDDNVENIAQAIRDFQTLPHRLEVVARHNGVTYVNDSQSTIPDASIAALQSFPQPVTLLLGGKAKIEADSYRALMAVVRESGAKIGLFGEAATMLHEVALGQGVQELQINRCNTLAEALKSAKIEALPGETIVLSPACASFDQFKSYEDRGQTFRALVAAMEQS